ncbi:MAG: hypothetical protein RL026_1512 [Pseudomonadota bacterium]|jgi:anti-anti-sigma regulatory factor
MASRRKPRPDDNASNLHRERALCLDAQCTLREGQALKAVLAEALDLGGDVAMDGAGVQRIDTAGLQLLVAFTRALAAEGRQWRWIASSAELRDTASQLGLQGGLGLQAASP